MAHQRDRWIHSEQGSFDAPWSEWSRSLILIRIIPTNAPFQLVFDCFLTLLSLGANVTKFIDFFQILSGNNLIWHFLSKQFDVSMATVFWQTCFSKFRFSCILNQNFLFSLYCSHFWIIFSVYLMVFISFWSIFWIGFLEIQYDGPRRPPLKDDDVIHVIWRHQLI